MADKLGLEPRNAGFKGLCLTNLATYQYWSVFLDSNQEPRGLQSLALPIELKTDGTHNEVRTHNLLSEKQLP